MSGIQKFTVIYGKIPLFGCGIYLPTAFLSEWFDYSSKNIHVSYRTYA